MELLPSPWSLAEGRHHQDSRRWEEGEIREGSPDSSLLECQLAVAQPSPEGHSQVRQRLASGKSPSPTLEAEGLPTVASTRALPLLSCFL